MTSPNPSSPLTLSSTVRLNNGVEIPLLGLGVFRAPPGEATHQAVTDALAIGYRHIDTAKAYHNERDVGRALRESGIPREEIFVTTKLLNADHGYDAALRAAEESLDRLQLDYLDLYLIHWPVTELRGESWMALEALLDREVCRAIGVSNYTVRHLEELLGYAGAIPAINQVEFNPFLHQKELDAFCRAHGIQLEAYSPLAKGRRFDHPVLAAIAREVGRTPAQVMIRWCLQHGLVTIPKSVHPERLRENAAVFDFALDDGQMQRLDGLDEGLRTSWDPTDVP